MYPVIATCNKSYECYYWIFLFIGSGNTVSLLPGQAGEAGLE